VPEARAAEMTGASNAGLLPTTLDCCRLALLQRRQLR
jgi:hypothetical protein